MVALLGLIAYVFRVIWPPLILAGAIVFLLNPVVTRLQARHIPRALGTGLSYLAVVGLTVLVVLLVAPLATRQYDELAEEWPELRDDLEEDINDLSERSEENEWPIRIPTWEELEDQFSAEDAADTNGDGVVSEEEEQDRFAAQISHGARAGPQGVPRRDHLRDRADHRLLPAGRPAPHPAGVPVAGARAGPWRLDGARPPPEHRDRRLLPRPARGGVRRRGHGVDRHAASSTCRSG